MLEVQILVQSTISTSLEMERRIDVSIDFKNDIDLNFVIDESITHHNYEPSPVRHHHHDHHTHLDHHDHHTHLDSHVHHNHDRLSHYNHHVHYPVSSIETNHRISPEPVRRSVTYTSPAKIITHSHVADSCAMSTEHVTSYVSPVRHHHHSHAPVEEYPAFVEVSPPADSPLRQSMRYVPISSPEAQADRWKQDEELRRKWQQQDKERQAHWEAQDEERKTRWAEDERDKGNRDKEDNERRQKEGAEWQHKLKMEQQRRDKEKAEREQEDNQRRERENREKAERDRQLADLKRQTDELLSLKQDFQVQDANKYNQMMNSAYAEPKEEVKVQKSIKKKKSKGKIKKNNILAKPKVEARTKPLPQPEPRKEPEPKPKKKSKVKKTRKTTKVKDDYNVHATNQRLEQIGSAMFKNQNMKPIKQKRYRAVSARQQPQTEVKQISEEEYLKTLYPHIDYTALDMHCGREHADEWYAEFAEKVFERSNQMKYDMFIKRCIKTSPYNDNGGEKYNMLKNLSKERSKSRKMNYEKNTIAFLAKGICRC